MAVIPAELEQARTMADGRAAVVAWDQRTTAQTDILINATPIAGQASPWPENMPLKRTIVFDLAIASEPSSLLVQAAAERAVTVELPGGALNVFWSAEDQHVYMLGPAVEVFRGTWPEQS